MLLWRESNVCCATIHNWFGTDPILVGRQAAGDSVHDSRGAWFGPSPIQIHQPRTRARPLTGNYVQIISDYLYPGVDRISKLPFHRTEAGPFEAKFFSYTRRGLPPRYSEVKLEANQPLLMGVMYSVQSSIVEALEGNLTGLGA